MHLANQVDGVHLDAEIQASRSPPGAASDAFLGGWGIPSSTPRASCPRWHLTPGGMRSAHTQQLEVTAAAAQGSDTEWG